MTCRGFSLIESLVALAILSAGLVALGAALETADTARRNAAVRLAAARGAQERLCEAGPRDR